MGFWIFMLVISLLIPLVILFFGHRFSVRAPADIQSLYGYRTAMSMKNRDTWEFAHRYIGRIWRVAGWILLPLSTAAMLCVLGRGEDAVGTVGALLCFVQMVPLIGGIIPTEAALRRHFDAEGRRRQR